MATEGEFAPSSTKLWTPAEEGPRLQPTRALATGCSHVPRTPARPKAGGADSRPTFPDSLPLSSCAHSRESTCGVRWRRPHQEGWL